MRGLALFAFLCLSHFGVSYSQSGGVSRYFESIKNSPLKLRHFLTTMPKGGDLHSHLSGAIYAESYLAWAAEDGKCVDIKSFVFMSGPCDGRNDLMPISEIYPGGPQDVDGLLVNVIDALSTRDYQRRDLSGHQQFFSTFSRFYQASLGRQGDMLAEVTKRAARQNIGYLELMHSPGMIAASLEAERNSDLARAYGERLDHRAMEKIAKAAVEEIDEMEERRSILQQCEKKGAEKEGCSVSVRYLAQVIRTWKPEQVYAQTLLAFMLMELDDRVVGLNYVAPEDHPVSLRDYRTHMSFIAELSEKFEGAGQNIALHAGELTLGLVPPEHLGWHIRDAVEVAGAKRIGHGIDISYDPNMYQTLQRMATDDVAVEINLTSNDVILGVSGEDHPISIYLENAVPITISTDDEGVSRINLTHEYQRAVETFDLSYETIKTISRNAVQYSFLPGKTLFQNTIDGSFNSECRKGLPQDLKDRSTCSSFILQSEKALAQWQLEKNFNSFEARF